MNIVDDVLDTYGRLFSMNATEVISNVAVAMDSNPRILKDMEHALLTPLNIGTVVGMGIGMTSDEHKVGNTILCSGIGTIPGTLTGLALAGKIAKNAKII